MREVATILTEEISDPRLALVTISGVRLNSDMSMAEVLYSLPQNVTSEDANKAFEKAAGFMRSRIATRLKLKRSPMLRFVHDDFLEEMVYARPDSDD